MNKHINQHRQHGVVLIISLIFLFFVTIVALSAFNNDVNQESLSGHYGDKSLAHEGAETALKAAETWLKNQALTTNLFHSDIPGLIDSRIVNTDPSGLLISWGVSDSIPLTEGYNPLLAQAPAYQIALLNIKPLDGWEVSPVRDWVFRITAHSTGVNTDTSVILQENMIISR